MLDLDGSPRMPSEEMLYAREEGFLMITVLERLQLRVLMRSSLKPV